MLSLIFSWVFFYDAERALHDTGSDAESLFWSRRAYVAFHTRNNLALICVPLVLFIYGSPPLVEGADMLDDVELPPLPA